MHAPPTTKDGMTVVTSFSPAGYEELVDSFLQAGYSSGFFEADEESRDGPVLVLRHDVDVDIELCRVIAAREVGLGVRSTFFFLLSSPFYNLFGEGATDVLEELIDAGHGVGLHFDPRTTGDPSGRLELEARVLADLIGRPVTTFSLHRPAPDASKLVVPGLVNAYAPRYVDEMAYFSDSRGRWSHGHPLDSAAFRERRDMQLLTHPIWWSSDEGMTSPEERTLAFAYRRRLQFDQDLAVNLEPFRRATTPRRTQSTPYHADLGPARRLGPDEPR